MSEKLSIELRKWFISLGFEDKYLSTEQIEEEFNRLSPPEMRDIWRNVMTHVVPVEKSHYIKKLLLLNELKRSDKNGKQKPRITKNVDSIEKLHKFNKVDNASQQLSNYLKAIQEANEKIKKQKLIISDLENTLDALTKENEKRSNLQTLVHLKSRSHEQTTNELLEMYSYLEYVNSFWHTKNNDGSCSPADILKDILRKINEFSKRRDNLTETNLLSEQEALKNDVIKLTADSSTSELHKVVIFMLKDTLSALLKLSDHISSKHESENSCGIESKLTQLKKQCVQLFISNTSKKEHVAKLRDNVENQRTELLNVLTKNLEGDAQKNVETWLDSECLKYCMMKRREFLLRHVETLKTNLPVADFDLTNTFDKEKLVKNINDCRSQLILLEEELASNLYHLSDEPINMFIGCQNYCKGRIEQFIKNENSSKHLELTVKLADSLKNEIALLQKVNISSYASNTLIVKNSGSDGSITNDDISEFVRKCSFCLYLIYASDNICMADGQSYHEIFEKQENEIKKDEYEFVENMKKLVVEATNNLQSVEEHSEICLKNFELWSKSSANEIIPKHMSAGDRTFVEWLKRYQSVIQCLRKQQHELNKYSQ